MSRKAKALLKQAVTLYYTKDGATPMGAYRDAVTDLLHLAYAQKRLRPVSGRLTKGSKADRLKELDIWILQAAHSGFLEEVEQAEYDKIAKISYKELPLHMSLLDTLEFDSSKEYFKKRLSGEEA